MWKFLANVILRNRFLIIGLISILTILFGYQAVTNLKLDNRYGILLPKNAQATIDYERFKELFGEDGGVLVLGVQTDSLYTEENFRKWKQLGDSILQFDGVESVVSEATLFSVSNNREKKKFEAKRIFSDPSYEEKSIEEVKQQIKENPLYEGVLFNEENASLMMIGVDEDFLQDQKKANVILHIEELAASYAPYFGELRYAGLPHLRVVIGKRVVQEMYIFVGLLIVVTSLLIYIFFRSFRVVLICNAVVVVAVIWSMGIIASFGFHLTIIMALIPPLMIVIGIPNCIFLMTKFHQEIKEHGNKVKALSRVIKKIGTATFLTNLTTSLGFLTFVTTNSVKLMEFGVSASVNILLVFVLSICILPIAVSLAKTPKKRHLKHLERKLAVGLLDKLVDITLNHRKWVYVSTAVVLGLSIIGMTRMKATGNLTGDLPTGHQILKDLHFIQDNFGGSIPFEIMIDYKEPSRLAKKSTLRGIEEIQEKYSQDSLFTRQISYIDVLKAANMAYHDNDPSQFILVTQKRKLKRLREYVYGSLITNSTNVGLAINELIDTTNHVLRIRSQMCDIGSYEVSEKVEVMKDEIDQILNPDRRGIERLFSRYNETQKTEFVDSIFEDYNAIANAVAEKYIHDDATEMDYFENPYRFLKKHYGDVHFNQYLRSSIDHEYLDVAITGASVVAAEGTKYLTVNLLTSLLFAVIAISILMAILFRSSRMVMVSLIPNLIPLLFTAGIMGWFGIPLKPSTLLVFSVAFGISVDDTIHYLAKYRQELKNAQWDLKQCIIMAIRETGLGMFYTSIVLFCGFSMFTFSQFGGTKALGLLVSLTLLVAMITNLVVLPSLLLSLERRLITKSFVEPYFDAYSEESDIDWKGVDLQVSQKRGRHVDNTDTINTE